MHLLYSDLLGKPVVDGNGKLLGRVHDAEATKDGDRLRITSIVLGGQGLLHRLGLHKMHGTTVPWNRVETIDNAIHVATRSGT